MIVVDASVAAKWLLPEAGSESAVELQEGPEELAAPDLIRLEVAAALTRRVRAEKGRISPDEALGRFGKWLGLLDRGVISLVPENELLDEAVKLSVEIKHTLQDCLYLAAARRKDASLITADKPFQERAVKFYKRVLLLPGCEKN